MSNNTEHQTALKDLASLAKWSSQCSKAEIKGLNKYLRDKVHDLVNKFKLIAENATLYGKIAEEASKNNEDIRRIKVQDKSFTVSEATKELHRLTDALLDEGTTSHHKIDLRKKIDSLSLGLFKFTKDLESKSSETSQYISIITSNIKDIIVAFQFHDFVNQRLSHIEMVFDMLEKQADKVFENDLKGVVPEVPKELSSELMDNFFLSDVKGTFALGLDPKEASNLSVDLTGSGGGGDDDDIELF